MPRGYRGRSAKPLFALIAERELSIPLLAERAGLTRQMFYKVRAGHAGVSAQFMDRVAPLFPDMTVDELFPIVEPVEAAS